MLVGPSRIFCLSCCSPSRRRVAGMQTRRRSAAASSSSSSTPSSTSFSGELEPERKRRLHQAETYHGQTKHSLSFGYARGPRGLDWANQPNPFLRFHSSPLFPLNHFQSSGSPLYQSLFSPFHSIAPHPISHASISQLFYDSLSLSAWKTAGSSTWSLRVNPSSGNLHPTEAYLISPPLPSSTAASSSPFVAHYAPKEHALEIRAHLPPDFFPRFFPSSSVLVGFSSIFWREAWKYGERAFRYCNHDVGHAIAAVVIAARALGWDATLLDGFGCSDLRNLFGLGLGFSDPPEKPGSPSVEMEHPDCVLLLFPSDHSPSSQFTVDYASLSREIANFRSLNWYGRPNSLSKNHIYWDIIDKTSEAVEKPTTASKIFSADRFHSCKLLSEGLYKDLTVRELVRNRRSAMDMDGASILKRETFYQMLLHCLPSGDLACGEKQGRQFALPFRVLPWNSEVHCALFVHRIAGLPRGLHFLVRNEDHLDSLKQAMRPQFEWEKPDGCPEELPLYRLALGDCQDLARKLSCHQDIAADGCFSLGMVARFEAALRETGAWMYPRLFWESGVLGQVLYLEAHAVGISATGIGCYFDDAVHDVLGLKGTEFQSLYHFTVGGPVQDKRIMSLPAYPGPDLDA